MNIHLKKCEKCGEGFDIGTNFSTCPYCRIKREEEDGKRMERKR